MRRHLLPSLILLLTAIAASAAHADPHRGGAGWGGGRDGREGRGGAMAPYGGQRGYPAPSGRGGYYAPPSLYEPPLAPYTYQTRPNSLGAQWGQQQDEARMGVREGRIIPLSRVVQSLQRLRPGRVLDAGLENGPDGRADYRVRWAAAGGQRMDFIIDAETGAIIGRGAE
jgi:hypothetical protein